MTNKTISTTAHILQITDRFGDQQKPQLMRELKKLRTQIEYETYLAVRKQMRPLIEHDAFQKLCKRR